MNIINMISGAIADLRFTSSEVKKHNETYAGIDKHILSKMSGNGIIQIIYRYLGDVEVINREISRIFKEESWASPLSSPENQLFVERFLFHTTVLTLFSGAECHVEQIVKRIHAAANLRKVVFKVSQNPSLQQIELYQKVLKHQNKVVHLIFEEGITISQLNAIICEGMPLQSLSFSRLIRVEDAKEPKMGLDIILSRLHKLKKLNAHAASITDEELSSIGERCRRIYHLSLARNKLTPLSLSIIIKNFSSLVSLNLDFSSLGPDDLQSLVLFQDSKLRFLSINTFSAAFDTSNENKSSRWGNYSSSSFLTSTARSIGRIKSLKELSIVGWRIDQKNVTYLIRSLTNLQRFNFGGWHCSIKPSVNWNQAAYLSVDQNVGLYNEMIKKWQIKKPKLSISLATCYQWDVITRRVRVGASGDNGNLLK